MIVLRSGASEAGGLFCRPPYADYQPLSRPGGGVAGGAVGGELAGGALGGGALGGAVGGAAGGAGRAGFGAAGVLPNANEVITCWIRAAYSS